MKLVDEINNFYYKMSLYELKIMNEGDFYNGLSYNSILYLNVISQTKECTVSKLAETLNITKSAVTLKVNELLKDNVVIKEQSQQDKRVFYIKLSPEIEKTFSIYSKIFEKIENQFIHKYNDEELKTFSKILNDILNYDWSDYNGK